MTKSDEPGTTGEDEDSDAPEPSRKSLAKTPPIMSTVFLVLVGFGCGGGRGVCEGKLGDCGKESEAGSGAGMVTGE
jgi:hypothetical protein